MVEAIKEAEKRLTMDDSMKRQGIERSSQKKRVKENMMAPIMKVMYHKEVLMQKILLKITISSKRN